MLLPKRTTSDSNLRAKLDYQEHDLDASEEVIEKVADVEAKANL